MRMVADSSGEVPSLHTMASLSKERIKMAPNRGTADRLWPIEYCRWPIDIVVCFCLL